MVSNSEASRRAAKRGIEASPPDTPLWQLLVALTHTAFGRMRHLRRQRAAFDGLRALDARTLADIGLHRADLWGIADEHASGRVTAEREPRAGRAQRPQVRTAAPKR